MQMPISTRLFSTLPFHIVVGMPALSPTMETGTISSWKVKEGDSFIAGDSLAEIETDKASIDFEAQDDGVVAKILVEAGSADIACGRPIMVTVEEVDDVAAFADYVAEEVAAEAAPEPPAAPKLTPAPAPVVAAAPAPAPVPVVEAVPEPAVAASVPVAAPVVAPVVEAVVVASAPTVGTSWGNFASVRSPLASILSADQKKYVEKYGSTGQVPL